MKTTNDSSSGFVAEGEFMATGKFLNYKFIVVNTKIPGFENPQDKKAIELPIRKTHFFIRWSLREKVSGCRRAGDRSQRP